MIGDGICDARSKEKGEQMTKNSYTPVRLSPHERQALERVAAAGGSTVSEALRAAIRAAYIDPPTKNEGRADVYQTAGAALQEVQP